MLELSCGSSTSHTFSCIPNKDSFVPCARRAPTFCTKETPVHPHRKLCMPVHPSQLTRFPGLVDRPALPSNSHRTPISPYSACHVIARAQQHVAQVGTPTQPPYRILVSRQHGDWSSANISQIECPDQALYAASREDSVPVFIPVVRQALGRHRRNRHRHTHRHAIDRWLMDRYSLDQMIIGTARRPQIKDAQMTVPSHTRH